MQTLQWTERRMRLSYGLIGVLIISMLLAAAPGAAQEIAHADGAETAGSFRLPMSHRTSVYFPPGSAELNASAVASIVAAAARLKTDPVLRVTVVGYADDLDEATYSEELCANRAASVIDALLAEGVPRRRMSTEAMPDEQDTLSCASEYCRQSYRRVALLFSKASDRQSTERLRRPHGNLNDD